MIHIPEIKDELILNKNWTFTLHSERRNDKLWEETTGEKFVWRNKGETQCTIKKGAVLIVDRIYIRNGAADYSSVTFRTTINKKKFRFWAKLKDVNQINGKWLETPISKTLQFNKRFTNTTYKYSDWGQYDGNNKETPLVLEPRETEITVSVNGFPVFIILESIKLEFNYSTMKGSMLKRYYIHYYNQKPTYILMTLNGNELSRAKTLTTIKKHINKKI